MKKKKKLKLHQVLIISVFVFIGFLIIMGLAFSADISSISQETSPENNVSSSEEASPSAEDNAKTIVSTIEIPKMPTLFTVYYNEEKLDIEVSNTKETEVEIQDDHVISLSDLEITGELPIVGEVSIGAATNSSSLFGASNYEVMYDTDSLGVEIGELMTESIITLVEEKKATTETINNDDFAYITLTKVKAAYLPYSISLDSSGMYGELVMKLVGKIDYSYQHPSANEPEKITDCPMLLTFVYDSETKLWVLTDYTSRNIDSAMLPTDISSNYFTTTINE